ncbi:hypothetical protein LINPERHAP1_LOCUS34930 [Linum perenne]
MKLSEPTGPTYTLTYSMERFQLRTRHPTMEPNLTPSIF